MTMAYHRYHGLDTRIVRIFNTYGPRIRLNDGRVVPNFIAQALREEPITVYNGGLQTRSFCYVSDLVQGIYALLQSNEVNPVNIGNPEELTILDFAKQVIKQTHSRSKIKNVEPEYAEIGDDPKVRRPDITRAKSTLGWEPQYDLNSGLEKTLDYFKHRV